MVQKEVMIKDKIKSLKDITDDTNIQNRSISDLNQCPHCRQLFSKDHDCNESWHVCTICNISLDKKSKKVRIGTTNYVTMPSKKYYRIINSLICYNCACNITREMKRDKD